MTLSIALFNAVSGLRLNQAALDVTAQNVANVNTEGYSRKIIQQARSVILVTDSMKFDRHAPIRIGDLSAIETLVTDDGIPEEAIQLCHEQDVELEIIARDGALEPVAGRA